jgi:hypothetical protein
MFIKKVLKYGAPFAVGLILGWLSYTTIWGKDVVELEVPEQVLADTMHADTSYIPTNPSIPISPFMQLKDIPVRTRTWWGYITVIVDGQTVYIPVLGTTTYRGVYYNSSVEPTPTKHAISLTRKDGSKVRLTSSIEARYFPFDNSYQVSGNFGVRFGNLSILLGAQMDGFNEIKPYIGVRYEF